HCSLLLFAVQLVGQCCISFYSRLHMPAGIHYWRCVDCPPYDTLQLRAVPLQAVDWDATVFLSSVRLPCFTLEFFWLRQVGYPRTLPS
ncbi:hypothetical protein B0T26DRAFT_689016, partial [Lasiosphaeria miniovina]